MSCDRHFNSYVALLLVLCTIGVCSARICVIPASISPERSQMKLEGTSQVGGLDSVGDPASIGGAIYFVLPAATCPTTPAGLTQQLKGAQIVAPTSAPAVTLSKPELKARYRRLGVTTATITMTGYQVQFSAGQLADNGSGGFTASLQAIGVNGNLQLEILGRDAVTKPVSGTNVTASQQVTVAVTATGLDVELVNFEMEYAYPPSSKAVMTGSIYATAEFGDAKYYNLTDFPTANLPVVLAPPPPPLKAPAGVDLVCVVPIQLDSTKCPVSIGGSVTAEGLGTFQLSQPGPASLTGFVYVVLPLCKCPTTPAQWAAALPNAVMYQPLDRSGLYTDPASVKTEVGGGLATVAFNGIQIAVETKIPLSLNATDSYNVAVVMRILAGTVVPSMASKPRSLTSERLSPANSGLLSIQSGTLQLNYPGISLPVKDPGSADLTIQTTLMGVGNLAAAFPALATNFNASLNSTDGPCGVVRFPPPVMKPPPPVQPPPPSPEPEPSIVIGSSSGGPSGVGPSFSLNNCPPRMGPTDGTCGCTDGWYGGDCVTCQVDDACSSWLDPTTSTCNTSFVFSPLTVYKAYTCNFLDKVIADFITSASFICNVRGEKLRFENSTLGLLDGGILSESEKPSSKGVSPGLCRMVATMQDQENNPLVCTGTDCTFDGGKANGMCKKVNCYCPSGCPPIVNNIFTKITTISLQCPNSGGQCKLVADGLDLTPAMECKVGECTLPETKAQELVKTTSGATRSWVPIIASTPLWALGFVAIACGLYLALHRGLFVLPDMRAAMMAGNGKGPGMFAPGSPVAESALSATELLGANAQRYADSVRASGANTTAQQPSSIYQGSSLFSQNGRQQYASGPPGAVTEATDAHGDLHGGLSGNYGTTVGGGYPINGYAATTVVAGKEGYAEREERGGVGYDGDYNQTQDQRLGHAAGLLVFSGITCSVWDDRDSLGERVRNLVNRMRGGGQTSYALPTEGVVAVASGDKRGIKTLLDNVSGQAREGEVTAVMGPSGSGKTTLLGVLSSTFQGLSDGTQISGVVSLCDETRRNILSNATAFVPQKDVLLPALTVAESLQYSALLRLPHHLNGDEIRERIAGVLMELGLARVAYSKVGGSSSIRGVSGGERRRVTIGMELVTSPRLIIMDEPTSGLDSYTSYNLLLTCKQVAQRGRIVVMSVHQPSPTMFYEFDSTLFLSRGHLVYSGPPGHLEQYLEQAGYPTPRHTPIADHMLNLISEDTSLQALLSHLANPRPPATRTRSRSRSRTQPLDAEVGKPVYMGRDDVLLDSSTAQQAKARRRMLPEVQSGCWLSCRHFAREVAVLYRRSALQLVRTPSMLLLHTATAIIMGLLVGAVFYDLKFNTAGAQNRAGFMFFSLCLFGFTSLTIIDSLALERELVVREVKSRYYSVSSYLIAKLVLDGLLLRIFPAFIYALLTHFLVGLNPVFSKAATYFFLLAAFSCTVGTLALAMSAIFPQTSSALLVMNVILLMWVLMGGFLVNAQSIPLFLRWVRFVSPMSYVFEGIVVNEIKGQMFELALDGVGKINNVDGVVLVKLIGLNPNRLAGDVGASIASYLFSLGLAFACYALAVLPLQRWLLSFLHPKPSRQTKQQSSR